MITIPDDIVRLNIHSAVIVEIDGYEKDGTAVRNYIPLFCLSYTTSEMAMPCERFYSAAALCKPVYVKTLFDIRYQMSVTVREYLNKGVEVYVGMMEKYSRKLGRIYDEGEADLIFYKAMSGERNFAEIFVTDDRKFTLHYEISGKPYVKENLHEDSYLYEILKLCIESGYPLIDVQGSESGFEVFPLFQWESDRVFVDKYYIISCLGDVIDKIYLSCIKKRIIGTTEIFQPYYCPTPLNAMKFATEEEAYAKAMRFSASWFPGGMFEIDEIDEKTAVMKTPS